MLPVLFYPDCSYLYIDHDFLRKHCSSSWYTWLNFSWTTYCFIGLLHEIWIRSHLLRKESCRMRSRFRRRYYFFEFPFISKINKKLKWLISQRPDCFESTKMRTGNRHQRRFIFKFNRKGVMWTCYYNEFIREKIVIYMEKYSLLVGLSKSWTRSIYLFVCKRVFND